MKVLFLTTAEIPLIHEHIFTRNVALGLYQLYLNRKSDEIFFVSLQFRKGIKPYVERQNNQKIDTYTIYVDKEKSHEEFLTDLSSKIQELNPDVIHSQLIDGYDIEMAKMINVPIFNTIHVGGMICPRSDSNGFLRPDDSICTTFVGNHCKKCMFEEFPVPKLAMLLHPIVSKGKIGEYFRNRKSPIFYFTPLAKIDANLKERQRLIRIFKDTNLIAANKKLVEILKKNGLTDKVHYLPHGVMKRNRLDYPEVIDGKVKFYMLNRIQYSKALHVVMRAFKGIDKEQYELHILGDSSSSRTDRLYSRKIKFMSRKLNVIFHGAVPNNQLENYIKDYHVMIHAAIYHETYGIAIAESLSMGRPVIATRCGGAEEQVKDGRNGWLIESNDTDQMRSAILNVISNSDSLIEYSRRCELPHSIDDYVRKLDQMYRESIEEKIKNR